MQARDIRRHHIERLKNKRKHYWGFGKANFSGNGIHEMNSKQLGAVVQHPQSCSCFGCGNARKHYGNGQAAKTLKEQRQIEAIRKIEFEV